MDGIRWPAAPAGARRHAAIETGRRTSENQYTRAIDISLKLTEMASSLKQKYETNPYVTVTGFTFNAAVPPSVSVNFEFKKK